MHSFQRCDNFPIDFFFFLNNRFGSESSAFMSVYGQICQYHSPSFSSLVLLQMFIKELSLQEIYSYKSNWSLLHRSFSWLQVSRAPGWNPEISEDFSLALAQITVLQSKEMGKEVNPLRRNGSRSLS